MKKNFNKKRKKKNLNFKDNGVRRWTFGRAYIRWVSVCEQNSDLVKIHGNWPAHTGLPPPNTCGCREAPVGWQALGCVFLSQHKGPTPGSFLTLAVGVPHVWLCGVRGHRSCGGRYVLQPESWLLVSRRHLPCGVGLCIQEMSRQEVWPHHWPQ